MGAIEAFILRLQAEQHELFAAMRYDARQPVQHDPEPESYHLVGHRLVGAATFDPLGRTRTLVEKSRGEVHRLKAAASAEAHQHGQAAVFRGPISDAWKAYDAFAAAAIVSADAKRDYVPDDILGAYDAAVLELVDALPLLVANCQLPSPPAPSPLLVPTPAEALPPPPADLLPRPRDESQPVLVRAMALLYGNPESRSWPVTRIAKEIGCSRQYLHEIPEFMRAREMLRPAVPHGTKDKDGNLEAWEDGEVGEE